MYESWRFSARSFLLALLELLLLLKLPLLLLLLPHLLLLLLHCLLTLLLLSLALLLHLVLLGLALLLQLLLLHLPLFLLLLPFNTAIDIRLIQVPLILPGRIVLVLVRREWRRYDAAIVIATIRLIRRGGLELLVSSRSVRRCLRHVSILTGTILAIRPAHDQRTWSFSTGL